MSFGLLTYGSQDPRTVTRTWLPLRVGDRWTYQEEIRGGDRTRPEVTRWEQQDTTVAIRVIAQGVLIERKVEFLGSTSPPHFQERLRQSNLLVHNNCIYYVNDSQSDGGNNPQSGLNPDFAGVVGDGGMPDVCLPLRTGRSWGNPKQMRDSWTVAGRGRKNVDDPGSVTPQAWRIEAHLASGDDNYLWFEQGVGLTAERVYHNGTYDDYRVRLVRFEPGKAPL